MGQGGLISLGDLRFRAHCQYSFEEWLQGNPPIAFICQ
jgi:hypothetical protein